MADQWTKHLADQGYTGLSLPSNEFDLLTLAYEWHGARSHEDAFDNLAPDVRANLPPPKENANIPAISGERTRNFDLNIGIKILSGLISALGGGSLGADFGATRARKLTFSYDGVSSETLNAVSLQAELNRQAMPEEGSLLRKWIDDHLYVVTSVLRSKKITVTGTDEYGNNASLDVPVINNVASGNLAVKFAGGDKSTVTFEGDTPVTFAVKIYQIVPTGGGDKLTLKTVKQGTQEMKAFTQGHAVDGVPSSESVALGADTDGPSAVILPYDPESAVPASEAEEAPSVAAK